VRGIYFNKDALFVRGIYFNKDALFVITLYYNKDATFGTGLFILIKMCTISVIHNLHTY